MKKFILPLFFLASCVFASTPIDGVVAIVNNGVVTQSELNHSIAFEKMRIQGAGIALPSEATLRSQALQGLIIKAAALQMAQKNGISVSDQTVTNTLQIIAERNKTSIQSLYKHLAMYGISVAQYKKSIKDNLTIRQLEQQAISSNIMVTPDEINNFLAQQKHSKAPNKQYDVAHILIALPNNPKPSDIKKAQAKANMVYQKIQKGLDFKAAAVKYSDSDDAAKGGVLGYESLDMLPTLFEQPVTKLKNGQMSKPFKSATGFHIIKLLGTKTPKAAKHFVKQYQLQQILIKVSPITSNVRAKAILSNLRTAIKNGKFFGKLARENSQDIITAANGGNMGWESAASLSPAYNAIASRLKIGEMSQPFKTSKGWVLLRLNNTRQKDDTKDFERQMAANAIFQKKAMEAVNTWRAELKGESYIKIIHNN